MVGIKIHGSMNLRGSDTEIQNLEIEEIAGDPINPGIGSIWINTLLNKLSYVELVNGTQVIKRVASVTDINSQTTIINNTTNNFIFGQPIYNLSNGSFDLAVATNIDKKDVIGIISSDFILSGGGSGNAIFSGRLTGTIQQWEIVTSMVGGLVPNKKYFLDTNTGLLTINAPTDIGQFICQIGRAISTTELIIKIEQPITI